MKILVLAAHPDDEILGMGSTIKKLTHKKNKVELCVVSEGATAQYKNSKMIEVRKNACLKAGKLVGISKFHFLEFPDMKLDTVSNLEINKKLEKIIKQYKPEVVYTVSNNDLNKDHQIVYESALVVTRPTSSSVKQLISYEVPGYSKEAFEPNIYEDVEKYFKTKLEAFKFYKTEIEKNPHPRSLNAIKSWASFRGIESGLKKAEAFCLVKYIKN